MKKMIIAINVVALIVALGYVGSIFFGVYASAFNPAGGRNFYSSEVLVMCIVAGAVVLSLIFSHKVLKGNIFWAILPIIVVGGVVLYNRVAEYRTQYLNKGYDYSLESPNTVITEEELSQGWYFGKSKKIGTPDNWTHQLIGTRSEQWSLVDKETK